MIPSVTGHPVQRSRKIFVTENCYLTRGVLFVKVLSFTRINYFAKASRISVREQIFQYKVYWVKHMFILDKSIDFENGVSHFLSYWISYTILSFMMNISWISSNLFRWLIKRWNVIFIKLFFLLILFDICNVSSTQLILYHDS